MKPGIMAVRVAGVLLLGGCRVGPKYNPPALPAPPAFKESSPAAYTSTPPGTWQPARPQDAELKGKWWEMFNEPELNALEEQLNIDNQNIAQYFQNFMAARAQVARGALGVLPHGDGESVVQQIRARRIVGRRHVRQRGQRFGRRQHAATTNTAIALPVDVSWAPDLWGRIRNTVREAQYAAQVSAADLENERLTEQATLAEYYFQLRGQDALQDLYNRTIEADRELLELTQALVETGIDSPEDVAQARGDAGRSGRGGRRPRHQSRDVRARHRHADRQAGVQLFHAREDADDAAAADPRRRSVGAAPAASRYRRGRADHGAGQRADRRGEGRVLSQPEPHRQRRLRRRSTLKNLFSLPGAVLVAGGLGVAV